MGEGRWADGARWSQVGEKREWKMEPYNEEKLVATLS